MTMRAKKRLGQHFLVDENILGVIGRLAELADDDVVLEIGPGLGVLTTFLADHVAQVYAVELDTSLGPQLVERLAGRPNVELRFGDALKLDLAEAAPSATKLVANLPYNVATPLIAESLDRLPGIALWTVMVLVSLSRVPARVTFLPTRALTFASKAARSYVLPSAYLALPRAGS